MCAVMHGYSPNFFCVIMKVIKVFFIALFFCLAGTNVASAITQDATKLRIYAHSLNSVLEDNTGTYTFTYSTNSNAQSGRIVFYRDSMYIFPVLENDMIVRKDTVIWKEVAGSYPLEGELLQTGTHSVQITKYDLPQYTNHRAYRNMTWAVELKNEKVTQIYKIYENKNFRCPQGIAIDNNPDSEFFGRIYIANAPTSMRDGLSNDRYDHGIVVLDPVSNQDIPFQKVGEGKTAYKPEGWNFPADENTVELADHHWFMQSIAVNPKNNHVYFAKSTDSDADGVDGTAVYEMTPDAENVLTGSKDNNVVAGLSDITRVNSIAFDEKGNLYLINEATNVEEKDNGVTKYRATGKLFKLKQEDDDAAYDCAIKIMNPEDTLKNTEVKNYNRYSKDLSHWYNPYNSLFVHARGGIWVSQFEGNNLDKYPVLGHLHMDNYGDSDKPKKEFQLDIAWRPTRYYNKHLGKDHWSSYAPFWNAQMLFGDYTVEDAEVNYGDGNQKTYVETKDIGGVIAYHEKGGRYSKSAFLAVAALDTVHIFAIKYEDVFPSWRNEWYGFGIDHLCKIPIEGLGTVSANNNRPLITSMAFDYAGNLYVTSEKAHSLTVYSFQNYNAIDSTQHLCPDAWTNGGLRPSGDNVLNRNNPLDDNFTAVPARKSLTVSGVVAFNDNTNDHQWSTPGNWSTSNVPYKNESVIIMQGKTAEIKGNLEATAYGIELEEGSKLHIYNNGGLTVGPEGLFKKDGNCISQEEADRIVIESTPSASGFLRISPDFTKCEPYVTVNYTSSAEPPVGSTSNDDAKWQYMGAPVSGLSYTIDNNTVIYNWNEEKGWVKERNTFDLTPFVGYALTQKYPGVVRTFVGQMIRENKDINLTYTSNGMNGDNLFVNSYLAPINMTTITESDWVDTEDKANKTFYLFNSGSWNQWQNALKENNSDTTGVRDNSPGHYYAIPAFGAKYLTEDDQIVIPSMQGVYVARQSGSEPVQLKLNYRKHVWNYGGDFDKDLTLIREVDMNRPMRVVSNERASIKRVRVHVYGLNSGADRAYIIEKQGCSQGYDNGYDAENIFVDNLVNIYTQEEFGQMEVSFSDDIDSTYIGLAAGVDSVYTLTIGALEGKGLYLRDLANDSIMSLSDGLRYTFVAAPNSVNDYRFQLVLDKDIPSDEPGTGNNGVTTDIENITSAINCWYDSNKVYFTNAYAGMMVRIYDINGRLITHVVLGGNTGSVDVANLPEGVYMVKAMNCVTKFVK